MIGRVLAATLVCAAAALGAQQSTFRSEINFVQLPVWVLDGRGESVSGLTQSDFQVLEDGTPQAITTFAAVDIPFIKPSLMPSEPVPPFVPGGSDDDGQVEGRVYVFMLDNSGSEDITLRMKHVVRAFIRDRLSANDVAAVTMTGMGRGQDFTRDRRLLHAAINRFISDPDTFGHDVVAHRVLTHIANTAESMGSIKGRRKALVLVTASPICLLIALRPAEAECGEGVRHALRVAVRSDVSIYVIDPRGLVATHGTPAEMAQPPAKYPLINRGPFDGARYLAEQSGGFALVNTNNLSAGFARIVRENSSYYLLGYYSTNTRADGKLRNIVVTVSPKGAQAVHRPGYFGPAAISNP
jgi:VWFA-related protein